MPDLDIPGVVRALNAHGVRYVVIGGVAALVHNLPLPATVDIDVTPSRDPRNLERLAAYTPRPMSTPSRPTTLPRSSSPWPPGEQLKQASGRAKDLEHLDRFYEES